MKKLLFLLATILLMPTQGTAQSFLDQLKSALGSKSGSSETSQTTGKSSLTDLVTGLISKTPLNGAGIKGTWVYEAPYVAFESDNMLNNAASTFIAEKIEGPLTKVFDVAGVKPGSLVLVFDGEGKVTAKLGGREVPATYTIDGANLTLTIKNRDIAMNVKQVGQTMQISMNASRLLSFLTGIAEKAASINANFANVSQLISQYKGLYLGMQFKKQD